MDGKGRSDWKFVAFMKLLEFWKVRVLILTDSEWSTYIHLSKQTPDPHISVETSLEMPLLEV